MTAKESLTFILEEKKTYNNYRNLFYRDLWFYEEAESIVSVKDNKKW